MGEGTEEEFYEISAVARLTGLSTHVLRVWERRYGVVAPDRTDTKRRRYGRDDIHRLTLLKSLVDNGHTISSIAKLDITALEERLSKVLENSPGLASGPAMISCRIGMVAVSSRSAIRDAADSVKELSISSEFSDLDEMVENVKPGVVDLIIVEIASLFDDGLKKIQSAIKTLGARRAIVIFQFASDAVLAPGNIEKITVLRAPINSSEILLACAAEISFSRRSESSPIERKKSIESNGSEVPDRIFTGEQLVALNKHASAVKCECPQHLSQLLESIAAFEEYSRLCESRNQEDAELHAFLYEQTAKCRFDMEKALEKVLVAEGIEI